MAFPFWALLIVTIWTIGRCTLGFQFLALFQQNYLSLQARYLSHCAYFLLLLVCLFLNRASVARVIDGGFWNLFGKDEAALWSLRLCWGLGEVNLRCGFFVPPFHHFALWTLNSLDILSISFILWWRDISDHKKYETSRYLTKSRVNSLLTIKDQIVTRVCSHCHHLTCCLVICFKTCFCFSCKKQ